MHRSSAVLVLVNPAAGRGRARRLARQAQEMCARLDLQADWHRTRSLEEVTSLAHEAAGSVDLVAVVGGDGTVQAAAQGLVGTDASLGIIPAGGGNDFAKALGLPTDLPRALAVLRQGRDRSVDLGRMEGKGDRCFVNGLGVGLDGAVARTSRTIPGLWGDPAYLVAALKEALHFRAFPLQVRGEGWEFTGRLLMSGICNGPYHGGGFCLAPQAHVDDGQFEVYLFEDFSLLDRLRHVPKVRRGTHLTLEGVHLKRSPWVEIVAERPLPAHLDGELFTLPPGRTRVRLLPGALRVRVGPPAPAPSRSHPRPRG